MTAPAEGELAQRFPHGKRVYSAENSFHVHTECKNIKKTVDFDFVYSLSVTFNVTPRYTTYKFLLVK